MDTEPSDDELRGFVGSMLSETNLDMLRREPDLIDDAIREHREIWVMLYRVSMGLDVPDPGTNVG